MKNFTARLFTIKLILIFLLISNNSLSQENEGSFLFRDSKVKLSTFYAEIIPSTSFSKLNDQLVNVMEFSGGFILNNKFYLAYFLTSAPTIENVAVPQAGTPEYDDWIDAGVRLDKISSSTEFVYARFKHSGIHLGYLHNTQKTIFWKAGIHFGFIGGFNMSESKSFLGLFDNPIYEAKVITLEPTVGLGINMLPWWRINLDAGYRYISTDERIIESSKVDSFTFKFGFAFGNFRQK